QPARLRPHDAHLRGAQGLLRVGHPAVQHGDRHGPAGAQRAALLRPVRARDHLRADPRQDRRHPPPIAQGKAFKNPAEVRNLAQKHGVEGVVQNGNITVKVEAAPAASAAPARPAVPAAAPQGERVPMVPKAGATGKAGATDVPGFARGQARYVGESPTQYAERILDQRYGSRAAWDTGREARGPASAFNQIKKYGSRHWEPPPQSEADDCASPTCG